MTVSGGLLERDGVTGAVAGLVGRGRRGRAGALFVVGEAGLGKTAVLGAGCDLAAVAGLRTGVRPGASDGGGAAVRGAGPGAGRGRAGRACCGRTSPVPRGVMTGRRGSSGCCAGCSAAAGRCCWSWMTCTGPMRTRWRWRCSCAAGCGSLRAGLLASLRPWPGPALEAVMGLAQEGCARVERLAPLSAGAAAALLAARVGRPVPAELCAAGVCAVRGEPAAAGAGGVGYRPG